MVTLSTTPVNKGRFSLSGSQGPATDPDSVWVGVISGLELRRTCLTADVYTPRERLGPVRSAGSLGRDYNGGRPDTQWTKVEGPTLGPVDENTECKNTVN